MMDRPLIQIDDVVRPMTDEEYEVWLIFQASIPASSETSDGN